MKIHHLTKSRKGGKVSGFVTFPPNERQQAIEATERLATIRDQQHHTRPPGARSPWTSVTVDSWDGTTLVSFHDFHQMEPLQELFQ